MMHRILLIALLALTACSHSSPAPQSTPAQQQPQTKPAPPTPIAEKKAELGSPPGSSNTWNPSWDALIEQSLPPGLLSAQAARAVRPWCPRFAELSDTDKRAFWAYTFQAIAAAEAGLNATSSVHHTDASVNKVDPETHRLSRQAGLLQLKYEDAQRYNCPFDYAADRSLPEHDPNRTILQPQRNLACGLNIMQDQIITKGRPLVTRTSYWATLQPGTAGYRVFRKQMANAPADCRLHPHAPTSSHARTSSRAR
ncbi:MAG TPA: hypothetical protein VN734_05790 [Acidobacteriaceae bacterium]|nr:hypothetical protein [Acidobacteriaceae bacterium]